MSVTQMKITRAQCIDILDRFNETVNLARLATTYPVANHDNKHGPGYGQ
jgi:hypothetical protein